MVECIGLLTLSVVPIVMHLVSFGVCPIHSTIVTLGGMQVLDEQLPDLTEAERAIAAAPGMAGRIWYGQGMVYDESYQILMDLGILSDPKDKSGKSGNARGQNINQGWFNKSSSSHRIRCSMYCDIMYCDIFCACRVF